MKRALAVLLGLALVAWSACSKERPASEPSPPTVPAAASSAASTTARATDRFSTTNGELVLSPLEHGSLLFGWDGKALYVDPTSSAVGDEKLPFADVIFVTEARFDHLDAVAVARLSRPETIVVGPPAVAEKTRVGVVLREGETRGVMGVVATAVPLYSVMRGPGPGLRYHDRGRGVGYVIDFGGTRVYLSGDTECTPEVMDLERIDVAFVAVTEPTAMTPAEAARCAESFRPKVLFPYHDRHADLRELEHALAGSGIDLREREFYPRAEKARTDGLRSCAAGQFGLCRDQLDNAKALDPLGETDARVVRAREQVRAWQSPFPPWW